MNPLDCNKIIAETLDQCCNSTCSTQLIIGSWEGADACFKYWRYGTGQRELGNHASPRFASRSNIGQEAGDCQIPGVKSVSGECSENQTG